MLKRARGYIVLACTLLVTACGARAVRIADIRTDPGRYDRKTLSVTGVVTRSWRVPLVPFQVYSLDDGSGEITIVSRSERIAPSKGAHLRVRGRVTELASLGGQSIGLHLEERDRDWRR